MTKLPRVPRTLRGGAPFGGCHGRGRVREFIEALIRGELDAVLARPRYGRAKNDDACPAASLAIVTVAALAR